MKTIFENVIRAGNYDLEQLLNRIDAYHIEGKITDNDRAELYDHARAAPKPQYDFAQEIEAIWTAIRELRENAIAPIEPTQTWPEFVQPTGAHDAYSAGDSITFKERHYICRMDNCTWAPDVYPDAWEEQESIIIG